MKKQLANSVYIAQNLAVPVLVFLFVEQDLPALAYLTVILSKWRMVAINPRFWVANLRSNACDIIVGLSTVALMSLAPVSMTEYVNPILAILYAVWLLFIKPRSGQIIVATQAFICQFYGLTVLYLLLDFEITSLSFIVIFFAWIVGRSTARHFLSAYDEVPNKTVLISLWSFIIVQLAWVFWVWNVIYTLPGSVFAVPLISIVASILSYVVASIFHQRQTQGKINKRFIYQQISFLTVVIALIIFFTEWTGQV